MKLWQKGESIDALFEQFTIGQDPVLDLEIAKYDVIASKAHVKMLGSIELLTADEVEKLVQGLNDIEEKINNGEFKIEEGVEDCHSQIEMDLIRKFGDVGKKVHSGRSRNDQVLVALKLYAKEELKEIAQLVKVLFEILLKKSNDFSGVLMPGYTHMQVAMPSSFGLWFGAYAESLIDDLVLVRVAMEIVDKNPLGSAAGYGSSFPLDRDKTTRELGFETVNVNSIYAQMTRGKMEKSVAFALNSVAATLSKFAMDVCLYAGQNFDFLKLETQFTTGSSIMPHKHNPDGFELVRGKCNAIQSLPYELNLVLTNLPAGYHRDLQVLKQKFIPAINELKACLSITSAMTEGLEVNKGIVDDPRYDLLFTVEEVNQRVIGGTPFRDAYKEVASTIQNGSYKPNRKLNHQHLGSVGNPGNERIQQEFDKVYAFFDK